MSRSLQPEMTRRSNLLRDESVWTWLVEIEIPTDPPTRYRIAANTSIVYFGTDSAGNPIPYYPFPIAHTGIIATASGDLPVIEITAANPDLLISDAVDEYDGLIGQRAKVLLVNSADLSNTNSKLEWDAEVQGCACSSRSVTMRLASYSLIERKIPPHRISARACEFTFGDVRCGYAIPSSPGETIGTGFSSCPKTLSACVDRGLDEVARSLTSQHPERFGGHPGCPRLGRGH
jgi:phage-related protein